MIKEKTSVVLFSCILLFIDDLIQNPVKQGLRLTKRLGAFIRVLESNTERVLVKLLKSSED